MLFAQEALPIVWTPVVQYGALALAFATLTILAWLMRVWRSDYKENQAKAETMIERNVTAFEKHAAAFDRHTAAVDRLSGAIESQNGAQRQLVEALRLRPCMAKDR